MKKRIVCLMLTLILLVGMLPLSASAAEMKISEKAVTVLKQMQYYSATCTKVNNEYRNGYGTICDKCTKAGQVVTHEFNETIANTALRAKLSELEAAVNAAGLNLNQHQFDALVILTYDTGTSWLNGTGILKSSVLNGVTGSAMVNAFGHTDGYGTANWKVNAEQRRMIEANMYLNGVYSNAAPSNYAKVTYYPNGGVMAEANAEGTYTQYYDANITAAPIPVPTRNGYVFLGWYYQDGQTWVPALNKDQNGKTLTANWQVKGAAHTAAQSVYNWLSLGMLASNTIYEKPFVKAEDAKIKGTQTDKDVILDKDYIATDGTRWGHLKNGKGWVRINNGVTGAAAYNGIEIDVTVTVTNSTLNSRANASITSAQNGTYKKGDQLRIINTEMGSNILWGQVADENGTAIGWVALMYTNWNQVKDNPASSNNNSSTNTTNVVATAVVDCQGYLNVRSEAGTDSAIVGALADGQHVDLYEIKSVNGHQWGRTLSGWILLTYTKVDLANSSVNYAADADALAYSYTGKLLQKAIARVAANMNAETVGKAIAAGKSVTVSMIKIGDDSALWGYNGEGWLPLDYIDMDVARYIVVSDSVTVRDNYSSAGNAKDKLVKGVELEIEQIEVNEATIWGYTEKYGGWVNLASKYVQRTNAPTIENVTTNSKPAYTGLVATVANTGSVNIRSTGATYGTVKGSLSNGTTVAVWESNEDCSWYKIDSNQNGVYDYEEDGWASAKYLNVYEGTIGGEDNTTSGGTTTGGTTAVETGLGIVANTYTGVNIRQGAGTGYAAVGKYLAGSTVEILEVTNTATSKWGRTDKGWVCMDYITMVSNYPVGGTTTTPETDSNAGQNAGGSSSTTDGNVTIVSYPAIYAGTVNAETVDVYKTTDLDAPVVSKLTAGQNITIQELVKVTMITTSGDVIDGKPNTSETGTATTTYWARVNGGWILGPASNLSLNALDRTIYTATKAVSNIEKTSSLVKGEHVAITKLAIDGARVKGYAEDVKGGTWFYLDQLAQGAITVTEPTTAPAVTQPTVIIGNTSNVGGFVTNTSGYRYTGKVINTDAVNVRSTPSTGSTATTQLKRGASLVVYETTISDNMAWGRCDAGWVYLYYVDLTPVVNGAVDARVVYNDNTIIYTDVNCSAVAGTYSRMSVIDIYEIVGTMARTDKGWVSTNDLL